MNIINPSFEVLEFDNNALERIERAARNCYLSEPKGNSEQFVKRLIERQHLTPLEFASSTVKIVCDRGCCYDDKTKILTESGWKFFKDLTNTDMYYTLDDNNSVCLTKANKIIQQNYKGVLHHWHSTQIDLMVTPNHNMWVYDYDKRSHTSKTWKFIKSEQANNGRYKFNKSANPSLRTSDNDFTVPKIEIHRGFYDQTYPELIFKANPFFELIGWWVTDGCISYGVNAGNRLVISQTKEIGKSRIRELLKENNIDYTEYKNEFRLKSPQLFKWIAYNFTQGSNVRKTNYLTIPRWFFKELSVEVLESFLKGVIGGDGTRHSKGKGFQIYTASHKFAEDLVELCLLIGKCANIYEINEKDRLFPNGQLSHCKKQYVVSIVETSEVLFDKRTATKHNIEYDGIVYCVELPKFHRLYVMRNGKSCWCGNSHELVRHRLASFQQSSTRYCNYSKNKFGSEITVILPTQFQNINTLIQDTKEYFQYQTWIEAMKHAEQQYMKMLEYGSTPEEARSVLPNSLKTEIIMSCNFREWMWIFKLRCSEKSHPDMRFLVRQIQDEFIKRCHVIFDNK